MSAARAVREADGSTLESPHLPSPCRGSTDGQPEFSGYRLGNLVDIWVREFVLSDAGETGARFAARLQANSGAGSLRALTNSSRGTFGNYLARHPMATFVTSAERRAWNSSDHCGRWKGTEAYRFPWWVYKLKTVAEYGVIARPALMRAFGAYFRHHACAARVTDRAVAARANHTWMAVHVRLGDFATNRGNKTEWIEPGSMAAAAKARFVQVPDSIAIVGGGRTHGRTFTVKSGENPSAGSDANSRSEMGARSDRLRRRIRAAFEGAFPRARVELIEEVSPDADFHLLATAPMLVTAGGSYALAAALVSRGQRLTPALHNLNFVNRGWEKTKRQSVLPGDSRWRTYVGEMALVPP